MKRKSIAIFILACTVFLAYGCGKSPKAETETSVKQTNAVVETESESIVETETQLNTRASETQSEAESKDYSESYEKAKEEALNAAQEEYRQILIESGYTELESDGDGYATESFSNISYKVPDKWLKIEEDKSIEYKADKGSLLINYVPNDDVESSDMLDLLVQASVEGITNSDNYQELEREENTIGDSKSVILHYTCTMNDVEYTGYSACFNDSKSSIVMSYYVTSLADKDELDNGIIDDIFKSIEIK